MTAFTAPTRLLPYPLDRAVELVVETPAGEETCGLPAFPEDSDERITVLFRLSLNEFVALASAVDAGIDPAYGADAQKVWWIWVASVMCASFCDEMAACLDAANEAVINALAYQIANNTVLHQSISDAIYNSTVIQQAIQAATQPGTPATQQAADNALPENVDDCGTTDGKNALWGAVLYVVQSGNRAITDVFDLLEAATNTLERAGIAASTIPAVGQDIAAAAEFADQLESEIAENYAAAYTEAYEQELACDLFCAAKGDCTLSVDMCIDIINSRIADPLDVGDFISMMASFATGVYSGDDIANFAFLLFFMALKFGQQFGGVLGLRPLTTLMGLGADQLASDNWTTLCDCGWESVLDFTADDYGFTAPSAGAWTTGVGWEDTLFATPTIYYRGLEIELAFASAANITYAELTFDYTAGTLDSTGDYTAAVFTEVPEFIIGILTPTVPVSPENGSGNLTVNTIKFQLLCGILSGATDPGGAVTLTGAVLRGFGTKPSELP